MPDIPNIDPSRPPDIDGISVNGGQDVPDINDTIEATSINQMYSFVPAIKPHHDVHEIGVRPTPIASASYRFRNNTVSTDLRIDFTLPTGSTSFSFLSVDLPLLPPDINGPNGPIIGPLPPGAPGFPRLYLSASEERTITFSFNEAGAYNDILQGSQNINSVLMWNPIPLNVAGPVYVYKNLPAMIDPNDPPIVIEIGDLPNEPPIIPNEPEPEIPPTHLYLSLSPSNPRVPFAGTQTVELQAWMGDEFVAPNVIHAKKLNFAPGSLIWSPLSSTALTIDPLDGSSSAIFKSRSPLRLIYGVKTNFRVDIAKPPTNIPAKLWDELYRSNIGILGNSNAERVPLPDGTLAIKLVGTATS